MGIRQSQVLTWLNVRDLWLNRTVDLKYVIEISCIRYGELCNDETKCKTKNRIVEDYETSDHRSKEL